MNTCLYFTYDGLLDPLGQSQILPYILNLSEKGFKFIIISYEKTYQSKTKVAKLKKSLKNRNIFWKPLVFKKGGIHFLERIIIGAIYINYFHLKRKIDLVHLRGGYSGLIFFISLCRNKFIYDLRAFWGQWADGGRTKYNSITYRLLLILEKILIERSAGLIVLDKSGKDFIKKTFNLNKPIEVIPTSTQVEKFKIKKNLDKGLIKFVYLGGASFPPYRVIDAILLIKHFTSLGFNCKIDFINKNEHSIIKNFIKKEKLNKKYYSIISLNHEEIFKKLPDYDVGLVFLEKGEWIHMSSPTKIGEYLAAGLHIICNRGIAVLERLSKDSKCIEIIDIFYGKIDYDHKKIKNLQSRIIDINKRNDSQELAKKYYSLAKANKKYFKIYKILLN